MRLQGVENISAVAKAEPDATVPAKHFLQEDQAPAVAEQIAALADSA